MSKLKSTRLPIVLMLIVLFASFGNSQLQAQSCCPNITPTLVPNGASGCCFDVYLNRQDYQGCEITILRLTSLGGVGITNVSSSDPNVTATATSQTGVEFSHNGQFDMGNNYVGTICLNATNACGTVSIELYDYNNSVWICNWNLDWCCGNLTCCDLLQPEAHPVSDIPCCWTINVGVTEGLLCEISKVRLTMLGSGQIISATGTPAYTGTHGFNTAEFSHNGGYLVPGVNSLGDICFDGVPGCIWLQVEYFDENTQEWICMDEVEICCFASSPTPGNDNGNGEDDGLTTSVTPARAQAGLELNIQPNPVNDRALVQYASRGNADLTIELVDISGNKVRELLNKTAHTGPGTLEMETSELSQGQYILRLSTVDGRSVSVPFTVVR